MFKTLFDQLVVVALREPYQLFYLNKKNNQQDSKWLFSKQICVCIFLSYHNKKSTSYLHLLIYFAHSKNYLEAERQKKKRKTTSKFL